MDQFNNTGAVNRVPANGPHSLPPLHSFEEGDIAVLKKFLPAHYQPSSSPKIMVVGYSMLREGEILRRFHQDAFGFAHDAPKVVGCNIAHRAGAGTYDSMDKLYMGPVEGDAQDHFTWAKPFIDLGSSDRFYYDMAYIRNPDLLSIQDWAAVFCRAVEMTSSSGVVVSFIRREDIDHMTRLIQHLESEYDLAPLTVINTDMTLENDPLKQHFQLVIFRGRARR